MPTQEVKTTCKHCGGWIAPCPYCGAEHFRARETYRPVHPDGTMNGEFIGVYCRSCKREVDPRTCICSWPAPIEPGELPTAQVRSDEEVKAGIYALEAELGEAKLALARLGERDMSVFAFGFICGLLAAVALLGLVALARLP